MRVRFVTTILLLSAHGLAQRQLAASDLAAAIGGRQGTIVVEEVSSARILASYRPEIAERRLAAPGSTLKPFVLRQLIATGKLNPTERYACPRRLVINNRHFDCSHVRLDHALSAVEALAYSCNWYFATVGPRLTREELDNGFRKMGLSLSIPSPAARGPGARPNPASDALDERLEILGESGLRTTPLSLLEAYRRLALARRSGERDAALDAVFAGLEAATEYGTARLAPSSVISVAGKTGTSYAAEGPWTHGWFLGYAPREKPTVALVVFLEHGHGSDAAEIAGRVLQGIAGARP